MVSVCHVTEKWEMRLHRIGKKFEIQMSSMDCPKESCTGKIKLREKREGHWTPKEWKKMMGKGHSLESKMIFQMMKWSRSI